MPLSDIVEESGTWFTTAPATEVQRRLTLAAIVALLLIFVPVVVFSNVPLLQSDGFIPFIQGTMFVTELATAVLLYAQFAFVRSRAVLLLANGYLFTALIVVVHTVTFPRAFALGSLFGVGFQTTGWLHIIWHFVFPASAICYALLRNTTADTTGLKKS